VRRPLASYPWAIAAATTLLSQPHGGEGALKAARALQQGAVILVGDDMTAAFRASVEPPTDLNV
jgi:hypothetical protein